MPAEMDRLFADMRNAPVGTHITFQLEEDAPKTEAIITPPPPSPPPGMENGVFMQDAKDLTRILCIVMDPENEGRLLVHVLSQSGSKPDKKASPVYVDDISERGTADPDTHFGGGANKAAYEDTSGTINTDAPSPPRETPPEAP